MPFAHAFLKFKNIYLFILVVKFLPLGNQKKGALDEGPSKDFLGKFLAKVLKF
jgi:hypothetical protein